MGINFKKSYKGYGLPRTRCSNVLNREQVTSVVKTSSKLRADNITYLQSLGFKVLK